MSVLSNKPAVQLFTAAALSFSTSNLYGHDEPLETLIVEGKQVNLVGQAISASEGVVGQKELSLRPLSRTGEVLETIPGMVVTQHSGSGKANQYFLRGFNLDHGTDFSTYVDGMPVNMSSHGHGQGYNDVNFLIPEAIGKMTYKKGPYYADMGDFGGAGGVQIETATQLDQNQISLGLGQNGYQRVLLMADASFESGDTLLAAERQTYDGPWADINEDIKKTNLLLTHSMPLDDGQISVTLMAYDNQWNSADQIPNRAVEQGLIDELGSIDDSVGGDSSRYSLSTRWEKGAWSGGAYLIDYQMNLWSNFTYFLDDEENGDEFEQVDDRKIYGGHLEYVFVSKLGDVPMANRLGAQLRVDDIDEVGLYHTQDRQRLGVTRSDEVEQTSLGLFWENEIAWSHHLRSLLGVRYDYLNSEVASRVDRNRFDVDLSQNGGEAADDLLSLKASLVYLFSGEWEGYVSAGQGFHSNDARGATITTDPTSSEAAEKVDALVRSTGYEVGLRGFIGHKLNMSVALWSLDLDSELLFVGDAGNTEASRPSTRQGLEFVSYYYLTPFLNFDLEYAYTDAEFSDRAPEGNKIPGAVSNMMQMGLNLEGWNSWFASLRYRYFGERPLTEGGEVESDPTSTWNMRVGYEGQDWKAYVDVLNITDSDDHDIDYFYESRLASEPSGSAQEDIHYHPVEPRSVRFALDYRF